MTFLPGPLARFCERVADHLLTDPRLPEEDKAALTEELNGVLRWAGIRPRPPCKIEIVPRQPPPADRP